MGRIYLTLGIWLRGEVQSLNMTGMSGEAWLGLRTVSVLYKGEVVEIPAISGQSLGHAYQSTLVDVAKELGLNSICKLCARKEFVKGGEQSEIEERRKLAEFQEKKVNDKKVTDVESKYRFNAVTLRRCLVEDIGGYMATDVNVRRTSTFQVSYAIPPYSYMGKIRETMRTQQYARHVPILAGTKEGAKIKGGDEDKGRAAGQMIWDEEVSSLAFAMVFNIDLSRIGLSDILSSDGNSMEYVISEEERLARIKASIVALEQMFNAFNIGAKRSRKFPFVKVEKGVLVVTDGFATTVYSPLYDDFVTKTIEKVEKSSSFIKDAGIENEYKVFTFFDDGSLSEAFGGALKWVMERVKQE